LDLHSQSFFSQEILTHTQPTTLKPSHLNIVHFARDHLSLLPQHDLRSGMAHVPKSTGAVPTLLLEF